MSAGGIGKSRNWEVIVYPESAPADWRERLEDLKLPYAISPLHNADVAKDGKPKKPHYHVLILYPNTTTFRNAQISIAEPLSGSRHTICKVMDLAGAVEYLAHENAPDKVQYDVSKIEYGFGFNREEIMKRRPENKRESEIGQMKDILRICREWEFREFASLVDFLIENEDNDALELLMKPGAGNLVFRYLTSVRFRVESSVSGHV